MKLVRALGFVSIRELSIAKQTFPKLELGSEGSLRTVWQGYLTLWPTSSGFFTSLGVIAHYHIRVKCLTSYLQEGIQEFANIMSEHATLISNWATPNHLRLNIAKTKAIVIGSYYYINLLPSMQTKGVTLDQTLIKFETSVRSLGVILDSKLNWKEQVSSICRKAYFLLYRLNFFQEEHYIQLAEAPGPDTAFSYCRLLHSSMV